MSNYWKCLATNTTVGYYGVPSLLYDSNVVHKTELNLLVDFNRVEEKAKRSLVSSVKAGYFVSECNTATQLLDILRAHLNEPCPMAYIGRKRFNWWVSTSALQDRMRDLKAAMTMLKDDVWINAIKTGREDSGYTLLYINPYEIPELSRAKGSKGIAPHLAGLGRMLKPAFTDTLPERQPVLDWLAKPEPFVVTMQTERS